MSYEEQYEKEEGKTTRRLIDVDEIGNVYGYTDQFVMWLKAKLKESEEHNKELLIDFAEWRDIQGFSIVREDEIRWYLDRNKNHLNQKP